MEHTQPAHTCTVKEVLETTRSVLGQHSLSSKLLAINPSARLILSTLTSPLNTIKERLSWIANNESLWYRLDLITVDTNGQKIKFLTCLNADMQTIFIHLPITRSRVYPLDRADADAYVQALVRYAETLGSIQQVDFETSLHAKLELLHEALTDLRIHVSRKEELSEDQIHARLDRLRPLRSAYHDAGVASAPLSDTILSKTTTDIFDWLSDTGASPNRCPVFWLQGNPRSATTAVAHSVASEAYSKGQLLSSYFFPWAGNDEGRKTAHLIPTIMYRVAQFDPDFRLCIARSIGMDQDIRDKQATTQISLLLTKSLGNSPAVPAAFSLIVIDAMDACNNLDDPQVVRDIRLFLRTLVAAPLFAKILVTSHLATPVRQLLEGDNSLPYRGVVLPAGSVQSRPQMSKPPMSDTDRDILDKLKVVPTARYDSLVSPPGCLDGTRVDIVDDMIFWCTQPTNSFAIYWLAGHAGTGKSTIAKTLCERLVSQDLSVLSTFFVSKDSSERRDPLRIIYNFAYELAISDVVMRRSVVSAIRATTNISSRPLKEQVEALLLAAIKSTVDRLYPVVFVIDALDECSSVSGVKAEDFILRLAEILADLPVRLVVTSRMEDHLKRVFHSLSSDVVRLHEIEKDTVASDVRLILTQGFRTIALERGISIPWPSPTALDTLVEWTGSFVIFAATVLKFLDTDRFSPEVLLSQILERTSGTALGEHLTPVDQLYLHVLQSAARRNQNSQEIDRELSSRIHALLGTVILLAEPLSIPALAQLMNVKADNIARDVRALSAVLLVSSDGDSSGDGTVRIFHPSLRDFLLEKCTIPEFCVQDVQQHHEIGRYCLQTMNDTLKYDLCDIKDPTLPRSEISNPSLPQRIDHHMPAAVRYACRSWMYHIPLSTSPDDKLLSTLRAFILNHILHWIEALALMNYMKMYKMSKTEKSLAHMIHWTKHFVVQTDECDAYPIIRECYLMLDDDECKKMLEDKPLQIYYSGNIFLPQYFPHLASLQQQPGLSCLPRLIRGRVPGETDATFVFEGHTGWVFSVAFSPDGTQILSGSLDNTIKIWNPWTGLETATLNGHDYSVMSVAFSPDGTQIVSGSADKTIRLWDACTGSEIATLQGHTDGVSSVVFSHDGARIVSGSWDATARVWDAQTGHEVAKLAGHTAPIHCVSLSADSRQIATGSTDGTVRLWNAYSSLEIHRFNHDATVWSAVFSPDGTEVVSVLKSNEPLKAWSIQTGMETGRSRHDGKHLTCVAFSPDGVFLACSSDDGTLTLWHRPTFLVITRFWGHTREVNSVAFSPNGKQIISGADDMTVQLWDIPSLSQENLKALWDIHTKHRGTSTWDTMPDYFTPKFEGHTEQISDLKFSSDGSRIVSCSQDRTVRLWDAYSGSQMAEVSCAECMRQCEFSPDGKHVYLFSDRNGDVSMVWKIPGQPPDIVSITTQPAHSGDVDEKEEITVTGSSASGGIADIPGLSSADEGLAPLPGGDSLEVKSMVSPLYSLAYNCYSGWITLHKNSDGGTDKNLPLCWLPRQLGNWQQVFDSHGGRYFVIPSQSTFHLTIIDFGPMLDLLRAQGINVY